MSKIKMYSVYDSKAAAYNQPFYAPAHGAAIRNITTLANDGKSLISTYPGDYTLFAIGEFDELTGKLESYATPQSLGTGLEMKSRPEEPLPLFGKAGNQ